MKINIPSYTSNVCINPSPKIYPISSWEEINEGDTIQFVRHFRGEYDMKVYWELENFSWPRLQKAVTSLFIPRPNKYPSKKFIKQHFCLVVFEDMNYECISSEDGFKTFESEFEKVYSKYDRKALRDYLRTRSQLQKDNNISTLTHPLRQ